VNVSLNCAKGMHGSCTGCADCTCHHVTRPADFRARVEARKAEVAAEEAED